MTKKDQRALITKHGLARLDHGALTVLKELVTLNWLGKNNPDADAEAEPFRVGLIKLGNKAHFDKRTVVKALAKLEALKLVTIDGATGRANQYRLHLEPMKGWETVSELNRLKKEANAAKQATWQREQRQAGRKAVEDIRTLTFDALVQAAQERTTAMPVESNRERRLRHIRETPTLAKHWPHTSAMAGLTGLAATA